MVSTSTIFEIAVKVFLKIEMSPSSGEKETSSSLPARIGSQRTRKLLAPAAAAEVAAAVAAAARGRRTECAHQILKGIFYMVNAAEADNVAGVGGLDMCSESDEY